MSLNHWRTLSAGLLLLAACGGGSKDTVGPGPTGSLQVAVSGLPGGTAGRVTVSGPAGYTRTLSASTQINGLEQGAYRVSASYVNAAGQTWTATPAPDSVFVAIGDTAAVAVTYRGGPATNLNLIVAGTQLIQSTQRPDGSIPMIGGRDAMLRVFVTANAGNAYQVAVRVRVFQGGIVVDSLDVTRSAAGVPLAADTATLAGSWNVLIPGVRILSGMSYQVELDPADAVAETGEGDNRWPGGGATQAVTVQNVPLFSLRFVPVEQSVNGLVGQVSNGNRDAFIDPTRRMFPLGQVDVDVRNSYTTSAPAYESNDGNNAWGQTLGEMSALRAADNSTRSYAGIIQVTYGGGIAGLGYIGAPMSVSWDKSGSAPGVIAHELGHNFGRNHAPCGNPSGPDPGYPYPNAQIGAWGLDLPGLALKSPTAYVDLMSYCNPDWVSDYTYLAVLNARGPAPAVEQAEAAPARGLLVWGRIVAGSVILEPAFVVQAGPRLPTRAGPHRVEGFDAAGQPVFSLSFEGDLVTDLPRGEERHFAFVVPLSAAEEGRLAGLRLVGHGLTAVRLPAASLVSGAPARATVHAAPVGNRLGVSWNAAYPMALVRDARTGEVLSFARGGHAELAGVRGAVTVELSDGVRSLPRVTLQRP